MDPGVRVHSGPSVTDRDETTDVEAADEDKRRPNDRDQSDNVDYKENGSCDQAEVRGCASGQTDRLQKNGVQL